MRSPNGLVGGEIGSAAIANCIGPEEQGPKTDTSGIVARQKVALFGLDRHDVNHKQVDSTMGWTDMAPWLYGRPPRAPQLLTGIISERDGVWEIAWVGDGRRRPRRFEAPGLSEAADQATTAALALWMAIPPDPEAALQLAIYPWDYGYMAPMYDVTGQDGGYQAHDQVAHSPDIAAPTLEGLVEQMAMQAGGKEGMLRWIRRFADLPAAALG